MSQYLRLVNSEQTFSAVALGIMLSIIPGVSSAHASDWYAGLSLGANQASGADHSGWNFDSVCYPLFACFDQNPVPTVDGYRWSYAGDLDTGHALALNLGHRFGRFRLEAALAQRKNDLNHARFLSLTHLDASPVGQSTNTASSRVMSGLGDYRVRSLSLSAYLDFPDVFETITPYVGIGIGLAEIEVSGVFFSDVYSDTTNPAATYDPPLSFYSGLQDEDLTDMVLAGHLHAGIDFPLSTRTTLGLQIVWSRYGKVKDEGRYSLHPMHSIDPDFASHTEFDATDHLSLMISWRRMLER